MPEPKQVRLVERSVDFRAAEAMEGGDGRTLEGYAAVFDISTTINSWEGKFSESMKRGAFSKTLRERVPIVQYDHGHDVRVGSTPIASIQELREDEKGLYVQARLYDNPVVEPVRQAIEGGSIAGMSFRFQVVRDEWRDNKDKLVRGDELGDLLYEPGERGPLKRTIKEVKLFELGPVAFPAYESTSVGVRAALGDLSDADRKRLLDELVEEAKMTSAAEERDEETVVEGEHGPETVENETDGDERDGKEGYSVVADHGCGENKFAVVDKKTQKNESCHGSMEAAKAHVAKLTGGDTKKPSGDSKKPAAKPSGGAKKPAFKPYEKKSSGADHHGHSGNHAVPTREARVMEDQQMTVEERVARQGDIRARLSDIDGEYNGAALPEEIQTEWDGLINELSVHDEAIDAASRRAEQLHMLASDQRSTERAGAVTQRRSTPTRRPENIYDLNEIRNQARSQDEVATLYRDNAMRAVERAKFGSGVNKERAQENVESLLYNVDDEQGSLARRMLTTGSPTYERAWAKAARALNTNGLTGEEARALALGSDANGGYAVPFQLDPTVILDTDGVINPLRSISRVVQITGKKWQGVTTEGVSVSRSAEAAEVGDNSPTFAQPEVNATRVTGFIPFSVELESTWSAMRSELTKILADAKAEEEANSFLFGDGTGVEPFGLVETLDSSSHVADGNTFAAADLYALEEALPPRYRTRGKFLGNKSVYNTVRQFASGNDGADLWVRLGAGVPGELIGYPALEASEMAGTSSADGYLVFGDFQHFIIVDRIGMSVELVPHLFGTGSNRPTGQRGVLAIWSNGSKILVHNAFRMLKKAAS